MAHFASLDNNNIVIKVEVVANDVIIDSDGVEQEQLGIDFLTQLYGGGIYKQTSYNGSFRKNYAGKGFTYDEAKNAFIPSKSKSFASWTLNEDTCQWVPPTAYPDDGKHYRWNEDTEAWVETL
jgi:type II secretory pathway component GspD/PulD (secretin)